MDGHHPHEKSCGTQSPATASGLLTPLKLYGSVAMEVTDIAAMEAKKWNFPRGATLMGTHSQARVRSPQPLRASVSMPATWG